MQERVINGILCRRPNVSDEWTPISKPELTKMVVDLRAAYKYLSLSVKLVETEECRNADST